MLFSKGLENLVQGKVYPIDEVLYLHTSEVNGNGLEKEPVKKKPKED